VSPETITALSTGMIGVLGVIATILSTRSKRRTETDRVARKAYRTLERKFLSAMGHVFRLENIIVGLGGVPPDRPEILEQDDDDDDGPAPAPVGADARA
jgi:hypothetical protein